MRVRENEKVSYEKYYTRTSSKFANNNEMYMFVSGKRE